MSNNSKTMNNVPSNPKIYHILHLDKLSFVLADGFLWSDAEMDIRSNNENTGTTIGMKKIKLRRLTELRVPCYPGLYVGQCVPFYFCPRSIMLYQIYMHNHPELTYCDGQEPIIHLEADLYDVVEWCEQNKKHWAFTLSNAGARYAEFRNNLDQLNQINWGAVFSNNWKEVKEQKQAEFLVENSFSWQLIKNIGVCSEKMKLEVDEILCTQANKPQVSVVSDWYY